MSQIINPGQIPAQTNESKVRLIALFVLLLIIIYWLSGVAFLPAFLVIDFALRSFDLGKYSPLAFISDQLIKTFKLPVKPVYLPPKRFAARIGLLFSVIILVLNLLSLNTLIVSGVLALFAALESLFNYCAGCSVYSFLMRFKR